ncbi:MAG: SRPBCC family protein [Myxococcota bacterium]
MTVDDRRFRERRSFGSGWARSWVGLGVSLAVVVAFVARPAGGESETDWLHAEAQTVLEQPLEGVRAALLDLERFGAWFPTVVEWRVLSRAEAEARVYGRQEFPWPASDRDYVARYRWRNAPGLFVLEALGLPGAAPEAPPEVVRLEDFRSEWRVEALDESRTRVRYRAEGRVDGTLARMLARLAWQRETGRVTEALAEYLSVPQERHP